MSAYGKLNFLSKTKIYLVFFSLEMQRRLMQTKVYYKLCYSVWKETSHKPLKSSRRKKSFPSVYIIDTSCFDEYFLFHVITGKHYFDTNFSLPSSLVKLPWFCVLWNKYFERSPNFIPVISTVTLQCCLYQRFTRIFLNLLTELLFFYSFSLWVNRCSIFSFINGTFKTQKLKSSLEACFC